MSGTFRGSGTPGAGDNFPSEQDLADAVTAAELAETNASASEAAASTSEANAATSETNAATSASNAATSETNAAASESAAATSETNAATSESNAATSEANAATSYDDFDDRYLGDKASDPTLDNDGDALLTGALYWNTTNDVMRAYTGTIWQDVGSSTANVTEWTATASQTVFSGTDDKGATLSYTPGFLMVFHNGILLDPDDYTATNGTSVTLDTGATVDDIINMTGFGTFDIADMYTKAEADGKYAILGSANTFTAAQHIDINTPTSRTVLGTGSNGDVVWKWDIVENDHTNPDVRNELRLIGNIGAGDFSVLNVYKAAKNLVLSSSDITYDGDSIAREGRINTFTSAQRIATGAPEIVLHETDTTDLNWGWRVNAGVVALSRYTDGYGLSADKIRIDTNAAQLTMDADQLGYDSGQVPVHSGVATHNSAYTFVAGDYRWHSYHSSGSHTWTIPPNSSVAFPVGTVLEIVNAVGTITLARGTGVVLSAIGNGGFLGDANKTIASGYNCKIIKWAADQWFVLHSGGVT